MSAIMIYGVDSMKNKAMQITKCQKTNLSYASIKQATEKRTFLILMVLEWQCELSLFVRYFSNDYAS